ncbi:MAG TPA: SGNH hydrolase domain-containing protein, partial [Pseudolysinimonas sp.]
WPLLLFAREVLRVERMGPIGGLIIIVSAILLSWLTRLLVERPLSRLSGSPQSTTTATAIPIVVILAIVASSLTVAAQAARTDASYRALIELALTQPVAGDTHYCIGATARDPAGCEPLPPELDQIIPIDARQDKSAVYDDGCALRGNEPTHICHYGDAGGDVSILLIGNSHTMSWFPAFSALADKNGWRLDVFFRPQCVFNAAPKEYGDDQSPCSRFFADVNEQISQEPPYDLVVSTYRTSGQPWTDADGKRDDSIAVSGFHAAWAPLIARGSTIVVLRGVPHVGEAQLLCQEQGQVAGHDDCASPRVEAIDPDVMVLAAQDYPGSVVIDMTDWFCSSSVCPATIGNVKVYQDTSSHLTSTFALTMSPYLEVELDKVLATRG